VECLNKKVCRFKCREKRRPCVLSLNEELIRACYTQRKTPPLGQRAAEMPGEATAAEDRVLNDQYIYVHRS